MNGKVLGASVQLVVFLTSRSLKALHHHHAHPRSQVGVLAIGFDATSPTRVTEQIDRRSPHGKSLITLPCTFSDKLCILGTCLIRHYCIYAIHRIGIKRSSHTDRLWKHRCQSGTGHTMQCLIPPVVLFDSQALNRVRHIHRQLSLLLKRKKLHQAIGALPSYSLIIHLRFLST